MTDFFDSFSRPPHGGRGLKFAHGANRLVHVGSPPSRGAWIEISSTFGAGRRRASPPSRGAWIEIAFTLREVKPHDCRPPHGGRGLKYFDHSATGLTADVAPLTGGVD